MRNLLTAIVALIYLSTPAVAQEVKNAPPTPPAQPSMTDFFLECMKRGGTPGHAAFANKSDLFYSGPEYLFHIWTAPTKEVSVGIKVTYFSPPSRGLRIQIDRKLSPGQSMALIADKIIITKNGPLGNPVPQEFCIRQQPVIDLSGLGSLIGLSQTKDLATPKP